MRATTFIFSSLLTSAVSVGVWLLATPEKRLKAKRKISDMNHKYTDYISDKVDDFIDVASEPISKVESETKKMAEKSKAAIKTAGKSISDIN